MKLSAVHNATKTLNNFYFYVIYYKIDYHIDRLKNHFLFLIIHYTFIRIILALCTNIL